MKKGRPWRNILFLLSAVILLLTASAIYASFVRDAVEEETKDYLQELAKQSIRLTNERIGNDYLYLEGISSSIAARTKEVYAQSVLEILDIKAKETRFTRLAVADEEGNVYYKNQDHGYNIVEQEYFRKTMKGQVSVACAQEEEGREPEIVTSVPIVRDGKNVGAVLGRYALEELENLIHSDYFEGKGSFYVVDSQGKVLVSDKKDAWGESGLDEFALSNENTITKEDLRHVHKDMEAGENGTFLFKKNQKAYLLNYTKTGVNDWYLISTIPRKIINSRTVNIFKGTAVYAVMILLILGGIVLWTFLVWRIQHKRTEVAYKNIQSIYRTVPGAIVCFDMEKGCKVINANEAFYHVIGHSAEEFDTKYEGRFSALLEKKEQEWLGSLREGMTAHEFRLSCPDGDEKWLFGSFDVQKVEENRMVQAALTDITYQREKLAQAEKTAMIDPLTGLKNKRAIEKEVDKLLKECQGSGTLLVLDLDNFKQVNDTFGHPEGDRILKTMAECIRKVFRSDDFTARLGGDEFLIFMRGTGRREIVAEKAALLIEQFDEQLSDEVRDLGLSISAGASISPKDAVTYVKLYEEADKALYEAKKQGKKCCRFWDEVQTSTEM